ncbi:tetratricopeptide repeat protein [Formosa haliotis]|uniref:tetratricopeptide repeat protein n=1 Tax=Formosa haliotis TaxID=1555194 RepID=UPI000825C80A|nr:tetratricopeptide repeat protein [Formosa haliotis]
MTRTDFTHILQHPEALMADQARALKLILDEFPYFQPARALYLKALKTTESFKYNQELKTTAAYTTDRSILFDFITSEAFLQNEISQFIKQNASHLKDIDVDVEDISVNKKTSIDDVLSQHIDETEGVLDPELFQPKIAPSKLVYFPEEPIDDLDTETEASNQDHEEVTASSSETDNTEASPEAVLEIGKPLDFNNRETHSFNEWLKLTTFKPVDRSVSEPEQTPEVKPESEAVNKKLIKDEKHCPKKAKKFELIDKFISSNPKIDPKKSTSPQLNLAESNLLQPEALMTETLARIYVEQKNYKKAIQSYNILILKYPEKSGFFADRIKAIKQIQEHNKKN